MELLKQTAQPSPILPLLLYSPTTFYIGHSLRLCRFLRLQESHRAAWVEWLGFQINNACRLVWGSHAVVVTSSLQMLASTAAVSHYFACGWRHLGTQLEKATDSSASLWVGYVHDLNSVCRATLGGALETGELAHDVFAIVVMLTGTIAFAVIMGHMAALLSSMKSYGRSHFQQKMQQLRIRMDKLQLPTGLQNRVQQYYEHLWKEYDTTDSDIMGFTRELTHPLALEVGLCRYMALVTRVFIWSDCSPDFLSALVVRLNVRVYLAEDYIIRKGEIGYELFVVHRGVCEIASSRKDAYRRTNGGVFGELSLIMDYMRSSAVRALTNLELCVLDRRSFQDLVSHHHDERHRVVARMLRRSLEMNESPLLWQEVLLQTARMPAKRTPHETPSQSSAEQITETDPRDVITVLEAAEILAEKMNMDVARGEPMLVNIGHGLHGTIERREYTRQRRQLYRALSNSSASSAADRALQQPLLSLQTQSFCSPVQMTPPSVPPPAQAPPAQAVTMTAAEPSASNTSQLQCHNCASNNAAATSAEALQTTSSLVEEVADTQSQLLRLVRTLTESIERMETQLIRVEDKVFALEDAQIRLSPHASRTSNSLVSISIPSTSKEDDQDGGDGYADEASLPYPMLDRWQRNPRACLRQTSRSTRAQHATQALRRWTKVN